LSLPRLRLAGSGWLPVPPRVALRMVDDELVGNVVGPGPYAPGPPTCIRASAVPRQLLVVLWWD
jgi:hypothetical protein